MNELAHHGIKGQKWGVRRFQNPDGTLTSEGRERYRNDSDSSKNEKGSALFIAYIATMTTMYTLPLTAPIAVDAAEHFIKKNKEKKIMKEIDENTNVDKKTGFKLKNTESTPKEDCNKINPRFSTWDKNTRSNCMMCTTAYDMRRRGFDVSSRKSDSGFPPSKILQLYPKAKLETIRENTKSNANNALIKALESQGNGSRGNLMITWSQGFSGHSVAYEIVDNKLNIIDAQSNRIYTKPRQIQSFLNPTTNQYEYIRLDNVTPDYKAIREFVRDSSEIDKDGKRI